MNKPEKAMEIMEGYNLAGTDPVPLARAQHLTPPACRRYSHGRCA